LGNKETGARAALPIWMDFMRVALHGRQNENFTPPQAVPHAAVAQVLDTTDQAPGDGETH
jgi:penicillin-binding protein 1A